MLPNLQVTHSSKKFKDKIVHGAYGERILHSLIRSAIFRKPPAHFMTISNGIRDPIRVDLGKQKRDDIICVCRDFLIFSETHNVSKSGGCDVELGGNRSFSHRNRTKRNLDSVPGRSSGEKLFAKQAYVSSRNIGSRKFDSPDIS